MNVTQSPYGQLMHPAHPERGSRFVKKAEYSCKSILTIINDILDFSKIEAAKLYIEHVPFSLNALIENVSTDMLT